MPRRFPSLQMSDPYKPSSATFVRLEGIGWGLRVVGDTSPGAVVNVFSKNGRKRITVGRILGKTSGTIDDVYFCTIATEVEKAKFAARPNQSFDEKQHITKPSKEIPTDDNEIPFDPPYKIIVAKT